MNPTTSNNNVKSTYVCLTGDIKPNNNIENPTKSKIARKTTSKAKEPKNGSKCRQCQHNCSGSPNTPKSKPKCLFERVPDGYGSTSFSSCSICCRRSVGSVNVSSGERCLSTILKLDKEHNMFGLSNMAIVGSKVSRKIHKKHDKPMFPQKTIVQVCCSRKCTRSKTDLPMLLKCGSCRSCCYEPICSECCSVPTIPCKTPCAPKCVPDQLNTVGYYHGMKISFKRKQTYEPPPIELTPRSSCILTKPLAARSCHHVPQCMPPSSCFPYLMPCYWSARPGAPCSNPGRCFHNPPCPKRKRKVRTKAVAQLCPKEGCSSEKKNKCPIAICPGNIPSVREDIQSRFGKDVKQFPK